MAQDQQTNDRTSSDSARASARRIVVGVDGSGPSNAALEWAVRQAELSGSRVEGITAWEWPFSYGSPMLVSPAYDPAADAKNILEDALSPLRASHPNLDISGTVVEGHASQVLVDASKGAELLVVGNRGHGGFSGLLLGSVSERCTARAHCPVLVVRGESSRARQPS